MVTSGVTLLEVLAAPRGVSFEPVALADLVITSASPGEFAHFDAKAERSLFTGAFCEAGRAFARRGEVPLREVFEAARARTQAARPAQCTHLRGGGNLVLKKQDRVLVEVRVADALIPTKAPAGARVRVNDDEGAAPYGAALQAGSEVYVTASAPGYDPGNRYDDLGLRPSRPFEP